MEKLVKMNLNTIDKENGRDELWTVESLRDPHRQVDKAKRVQAMFDAISRRYDLANTLISFGQDQRWRKKLVRMIAERDTLPERILDLCCGTGSMMKPLKRQFPQAKILGADFSVRMLHYLRKSFVKDSEVKPVICLAADALAMPFADNSFGLLTCTFGLRNFQSLETGLLEIYRILRPGGILAVLEFQPPRVRVMGILFNFYFNHILPLIGSLVTGAARSGAYKYLPQSVRSWYDGNDFIKLMEATGFKNIRVCNICFGAVWAVTSEK